ncbi:MAG: TOTE conflict system archaeo-eukaryotic primase domain-containing protein [Bryobacteraceae bacterium]
MRNEEDFARLLAENRRLQDLLERHGIAANPPPSSTFSDDEKIRLFRSLFRGREDVYAVRWERADGRKGYMPRSERDWHAYNAARPEDKERVDRETRKYFLLDDQAVRAHLQGKLTIGIYPLLKEETCWFLAADFDKASWREDTESFLQTCSKYGVPAYREVSRSGNGAHIWIFFTQNVPASLARRLGAFLLTQTMEGRHQIGIDSYDRLFPNQDTMPKGGFGNLIALPLQRQPRNDKKSVFVNENLEPFPDQWAFLASVKKLQWCDLERLVVEAQKHGDLVGVRHSASDDSDGPDPWTLPPSRRRAEKKIDGPFPDEVLVVRANQLFIEKPGLPAAMLNRLLRIAAFQNPEFYKAQAMRLSTFGKPRVISCGEDLPRHLALPRGCLPEVTALFREYGIATKLQDERSPGTSLDVHFHGTLREHQVAAVNAVIAHDEGVVSAPTAFGKTAIASWLIAKRGVNALILVHRQQLLDQWRERLAMFLNVPADQIGHVGGSKEKRSGRIDVALVQSLYRDHTVKDFVADYGHIVVDECHHLSAVTFEKVLAAAKAKYVVGLTATPVRKDGHQPVIFMQCGPIRYSMAARTMTEQNPFEHVVFPRTTAFMGSSPTGNATIQELYAEVVRDTSRNERIARDIEAAITEGRSPLLLTGRTEHLDVFARALGVKVQHVIVLQGGLGAKQRRAIYERLVAIPESESRVILATGSYIGEGFDDARLDTLFLAMPISWKGTLQQYVGRLHRLHDSKKVVQVYDYVDTNVLMLARMYERRLRGYADMGYRIGGLNKTE